jgi:hypothetical protein
VGAIAEPVVVELANPHAQLGFVPLTRM